MSWLDIAHWMIVGCCLTLAVVHGLAWLRLRNAPGAAALAGVALFLAAMAIVEILLLASRDIASYSRWLWWLHLPIFGLMTCAVLFVRLHLRAGRAWLAWTAIGLRAAVVLVNFGSTPTINAREISGLRLVDVLGAQAPVVVAVPGPWFFLVVASLVAAIAFLVDASIDIWRRRRSTGDRTGLPTTIGLLLFAVLGTATAVGPTLGLFTAPLALTLVFTPVLLAMALELGLEQMRSAGMARALQEVTTDLQRSERRLALAAQAASAGFWEYDPETGKIWSTRNAPAGAAVGEGVSLDVSEVLQRTHPEDREHLRQLLEGAVTAAGPVLAEYRGTDASASGDHGTRWFFSVGSPMWVGSPPRRVVAGLTLDISDRKRAELELQQAKETAEAASRAKSAFLANMSHELRTPLHAILGHVQMLRDRRPDPENEAGLATIDRAGRHLLSLIEDVLDLARIESAGVQLHPQDFSLGELLEGVRNLVLAESQARGLALTIEVGDVPEWLRGDTQRLQQALLNYVGNALKFTPAGSVALRCESLGGDEREVLVRFSVTDTGIGIEPGVLARLFQPFEQADSSRTRAIGGTGLGLAITRRLAQAMGGETGASSRPGEGSTFWFTARLERARRPTAAPAPPSADDAREAIRQRHATALILLAEDNVVSRKMADRMLTGAGLRVELAHNGEEAVALARDHAHDLILMDLSMPVLDGLDATRAIRALPGRDAVPIIAVTGNAFESDRQACEAAGMNGFVSKPIDWPEFWPRLLAWLDAAHGTSAGGSTRPPA